MNDVTFESRDGFPNVNIDDEYITPEQEKEYSDWLDQLELEQYWDAESSDAHNYTLKSGRVATNSPANHTGSHMIFKDNHRNAFTWKVNCEAIPVDENATQECNVCGGEGIILDNYGYIEGDCNWCGGTGRRKLKINCKNKELEEFLEKQIEKFYKQSK